MQKLARLFLCTVLVVAAFGFLPVTQASAESYPSYVSGITMVNLSSSPATVTIDYIVGGEGATAGDVFDTGNETIAGNAVVDYAAVPVNNFQGSVVISSSQPIAAMSTLTGGGVARGSYGGSSTGSNTLTLPFLAKNHGSGKWNTFFAVQNIGDVPTTVRVNYAACPAAVDAEKVVQPKSSVIFDQSTTACLPNGITSAVVTSTTTDILAVVDQESTVTNTALVSTSFAGGSPSIAIPLVNANNPNVNGWRTAITIMNVGNQQTTVKLTYKRTDGSTCTETQTIPAQGNRVFAGATLQVGPAAGVQSTCPVGARLIGAAYIATAADNSTNQPLVATVNQDRAGFASAYGSFNPAVGTPKVVMPLIMDNNGNGNWGTSFNVMNVGDTPVYVRCTFANSSYVVQRGPLAKYDVFEDLHRGLLGGVKITSAQCTAYTSAAYNTVATNGKIVAVVNERANTPTGDGLLTYEAINVQP